MIEDIKDLWIIFKNSIMNTHFFQNMYSQIYANTLLLMCFFLFLIAPTITEGQVPFVTKWKTDNPGETNVDQISIPGVGVNYAISWEMAGDPAVKGSLTGTNSTTITFPVAGIYHVSITPGEGSFTRIKFNNSGDKEKIISVDQWGSIGWTNMENAFAGCINLQIMTTDVPDLSSVGNMAGMFSNCQNLNGPENRGLGCDTGV